MYAGLGFAALFFVSHGLWLHGFAVQNKRMALDWMLLMAAFNVFGAVAYALRVPERLLPYRFDFCGASHQIFHIMVLFAGVTHYLGLIEAFKESQNSESACGRIFS